MQPRSQSSRQKSCNACVSSKRRCDKRTPLCGRCAKRSYVCVYGGEAGRQRALEDTTEVSVRPDTLPDPNTATCGDPALLEPRFISPPPGTSVDLIPSPTSFRLDSTLDTLLSSLSESGFEDWSWQSGLLRQQSEVPSVAAIADEKALLTMKDYSKMTDMCVSYQSWHAADPTSTLSFTLKVFQDLPATFARYNCTTYLHRHLYKSQMPQFIIHAFSICMLYTNRTDTNRGLVLRVLHDHVTCLLESSKTVVLTPLEKLSRVHALLFYQVIRMFDGDITLGQQAFDDFTLLESWIEDLCKLRDNLADYVDKDEAALRNNPPQSWERWIFAESLRRTVIMGYALKSLSDLLRGFTRNAPPMGNWATIHRWTLSGHLWDAPSSFEFFRAWSAKPFWVITAFKFEEFIKTGTGDDLDEFARSFLTVYFGIDEMKTFCYETSGRQQIT